MLKYFVAAQVYAMNKYDELTTREEGQTMAEYGVVLAVITVGAVAAYTFLGEEIDKAVRSVAGRLK